MNPHSYVIDILFALRLTPPEQQVNALHKAPRAIKNLIFLAYGFHELALSREPMQYEPITGRDLSSVECYDGDDDMLLDFAFRAGRIFIAGVNPNLADKRRHDLWCQYLNRMTAPERLFADELRRFRNITGISREVCIEAFGEEFFNTPMRPLQPPEPYSQVQSWSDSFIEQPQPPQRQQQPIQTSEQKERYLRAYRAMDWPA